MAMSIAISLNAQEVKINSGEKWYGIKQDVIVNVDSKNKQGKPQFLISNKGRYIYSQQPFDALLTEKKITFSCEVKVENGGKTLREAYLYCYHRNFRDHETQIAKELYTQPIYDLRGRSEYLSLEGNLIKAVDNILDEGWPKGIILLGDEWQTNLGSYSLDSQYYTDFKAQIEELHNKGFKIILSVTPYVGASGRIFNNYLSKHFLVLDNETELPKVVEKIGYGHLAILDIEVQSAKDYLVQQIKQIVNDYNIDGIFSDASIALERDSKLNVSEFIDQWNGLCQEIPLPLNIRYSYSDHYTPSLHSYSYEDISRSDNFLKDYLNHKFMFTPFSSEILDGGIGLYDKYDAAKYLQHTSLMPMFIIPFLPYQLTSSELKANCTSIIKIRTKLSDYILKSIEESLLTREPLMRSLEYIYPRQGFFDCSDQYMLGKQYMIVPPNNNQQTSRTVRFPRGTWYSPSGEKIKGPVVKKLNIKDSEVLYFSNHK